MIDLDAIKTRLAAPYAAGAYDITVRLADGRLCATVRMRDWDGNTAHEADAAVTRLLGNAPADLTALVAEVERLRSINDDLLLEMGRKHALLRDQKRGENAERAAGVAWLHAEAEAEAQTYTVQAAEWARRIDNIADCIERGEHREEKE
jgi:hypothetical protein